MAIDAPHFWAFDHFPVGGTTAIRDMLLGQGAPLSAYNLHSILPQIRLQDGRNQLCIEGNGGFSAFCRVRKDVAALGELFEATIGYRMTERADTSGQAALEHVAFRNVSGAVIMDVLDNGANTVVRIGATEVATLPRLTSCYLEFYVNVDSINGRWELRIDGAWVAGQDDVNTDGASGGIGQYTFAGKRAWYITDVYFRQSTDVDRFQNPVQLFRRIPTADVIAQFTPLSGVDNFAMVDDPAVDEDTTHNESNVVGNEDLFSGPAITPTDVSVVAVVVGTIGKAPNGGAPSIEHGLEVGATKIFGTPLPNATATYRTQQAKAFLTAPDATAWNLTKANSSNFGYRVG